MTRGQGLSSAAEALDDEPALKERAVASTKAELDELKAELATLKKKP